MQEDLSKYTVVDADHLDEDKPIDDQKYVLFSFMSPEGIMNCDVRAVKFRGAFPTLEKASEKAAQLEKEDPYFKIFIGEGFKWLDFDPPASRVEREMSSNKDHQKILDAQAKQRMAKINTLAGKHKQLVDKKDSGKEDRKMEAKKASAASNAIERQKKNDAPVEEQPKVNPRVKAMENVKDRMKKRLTELQNKKRLNDLSKEDNLNENNLKESSSEINLKVKNAKLDEAEKNIENIKKLMASKKQSN